MTLVKYNPHRGFPRLSDEFNRFFGDFNAHLEDSDRVWVPSVDIRENENAYEAEVEIPGLDKKDIQLSVEDGLLSISGEKKRENENEEGNYHYVERTFGKFERSFRLPKNVKAEEIKANYKNGVLHVEIPKAEEVKPKQIPVS